MDTDNNDSKIAKAESNEKSMMSGKFHTNPPVLSTFSNSKIQIGLIHNKSEFKLYSTKKYNLSSTNSNTTN